MRIETPSSDEIQKVARYWRWVEEMVCRHETIVFSGTDAVRCGECDRPVSLLSDVQIADLRESGVA